MKRFVIGFGYEKNAQGGDTGLTPEDVVFNVQNGAELCGIDAYWLRFGPNTWKNDAGKYVVEQGVTVEWVSDGAILDRVKFTELANYVRDIHSQQCVVRYAQLVDTFEVS